MLVNPQTNKASKSQGKAKQPPKGKQKNNELKKQTTKTYNNTKEILKNKNKNI